MKRRLRVLIVDDSADDAALIERELRHGGFEVDAVRVDDAAALQRALREESWDAILTDHAMPGLDSQGVLDHVRAADVAVPCLLVSGHVGEEAAVAAIHGGAVDFVNKRQLGRLATAVDRALKEAEESSRRRAAEDRLRLVEAAVHASTDAIVILTGEPDPLAARIVFASSGLRRLTGHRPQDVHGLRLELLHGPATETAVLEMVRARLERGETARADVTHHRRDGTPYVADWLVAPVPGHDGRRTHWLSVERDVTLRRRAEEAHRHLAALVEASADAIVSTDLEGRILSWNPTAARIYGFSAPEALGRPLATLAPPDEQPTLERMLGRVRHGEIVTRHETRRRRKDGTTVEVASSLSPILDPAGQAVAMSIVDRDITERRSLERQLQVAQRMEAVGRLAGSVAHDFNNLLVVINGYTEILLEEVPEDHPHRRHLQQVRDAGSRAERLTRQLLTFSRRQVPVQQPLDLNGVIRSFAGLLRRLIGENVDLAIDLGDELGLVIADSGQVEQVVMNLAVNARDAMPNGGRLSIETRAADFGPDEVGRGACLRTGRHVLLSVADTGTGMDEETLERAFDPFFTTKADGKGTGLGLPTVFSIVDQCGGKVQVESGLGRGSRFLVALPCCEESEPASRCEGEAAALRGSETLLVVEDDASVRSVLRLTLMGHGYEVLEAKSGEEALRRLAGHPGRIALVLIDVILPGQDGRVTALRLTRERPGLKVLLMSGYGDASPVHDRIHAEGIAFLQKPFTAAALTRAVRAVLDEAAGAKPLATGVETGLS